MSEIDEMRVFVQLVEAGSATRAADRLGVAVSAVSRRMKNLETRLGVSLIQRTTRRMHVTEDGRLFHERCKRILADIDEAMQSASASAAELSGNLRIAMPLSFGVSHLAPVIADFMQAHPGITVDADMTDRRVDLLADGFDVGIRVGTLEDSSLVARRLSGLNHLVCCSPEFLEAHGAISKPEDLRGLPALCYRNLAAPERWLYIDRGGNHHQVAVKARMFASNGDILRVAAIAGLGVLCEPSFIVREAVASGELLPVLTDYRWYDMELFVVYPYTRHLSARVRRFVDFVVERLGDNFLERQTADLLQDATP